MFGFSHWVNNVAIYQKRYRSGIKDRIKNSLVDMLQPSKNVKCGCVSGKSIEEIKFLNAIKSLVDT